MIKAPFIFPLLVIVLAYTTVISVTIEHLMFGVGGLLHFNWRRDRTKVRDEGFLLFGEEMDQCAACVTIKCQ